MKFVAVLAACAVSLSAVPAMAQEAAPAAAAAPALPAPGPASFQGGMAPAGGKIIVATNETLNTINLQGGAPVAFTLLSPIVVDGREVVPAGAKVNGRVLSAVAKASGGRPGEMLVGVESLEAGGVKIALKGPKLKARGVDLSKSSRFTGGILKGSEAQLNSGTRAEVWLAENLVVSGDALSAGAPSAEQLAAMPRPPRIDTRVPYPPAGVGRVVFFREVVYFGGGWPLDIHQGPNFRETNLATINGGQYLAIDLPPGDYQFSTLKSGGDPMTIKVEDGEIVYVKGVSMGLGAVPPTMIGPSDGDVFNSMGKMTPIKPRKQKGK